MVSLKLTADLAACDFQAKRRLRPEILLVCPQERLLFVRMALRTSALLMRNKTAEGTGTGIRPTSTAFRHPRPTVTLGAMMDGPGTTTSTLACLLPVNAIRPTSTGSSNLPTNTDARTTGTGARLDTALLASLTTGVLTVRTSTLGTRTSSAALSGTRRRNDGVVSSGIYLSCIHTLLCA
ncbi:hypothetical protein RSOLAG22IIIB_12846 [Rhizoctonia solani]|uniref:Uncharacterized protein n=1 Tax=Rhizoctonia solani TaxID=456999 RepID=A0A0K6GHG1_9AGAM|nr:hypothetical protein RSOLAG22IIIB_12846 [Rhizoctonia solani]